MLIGRDGDVERVVAALDRARLVTIVGPGGVGKTSLATTVVDGRTPHRFVDLTPLGPDGLDETVAGELGCSSPARLRAELQSESGILLLDNCEHLIDAAADLITDLLAACPELAVLATSRERLDLDDEVVVPLAPLPSGGTGDAAAELFRVVAARTGVEIDADDTAVAALTDRLDGLPLAIELAAARAAAFTPTEMLHHLEARLDLLSRGRRRGPERQHSLRATIAWSYDLLDDDERNLLDGLSACRGPFDQTMAAAVAGVPGVPGVVDVLSALVDRSLVVHEPLGGTSWYRLLETIQVFAGSRLVERGGLDEVEDRLTEHLLRRSEIFLDEVGQADSIRLTELSRTFRARGRAVDRLLASGDRQRSLALVTPLYWLHSVGHQSEAASLIDRVVGDDPIDGERAMAAATSAMLHRLCGRLDRAIQLAGAVVEIDDGLAGSVANGVIGMAARVEGDWSTALRHLEAGAACADRAGHPAEAVNLRVHRALTLARSGDVPAARTLAEDLLDQAEPFPAIANWLTSLHGWLSVGDDPAKAARIGAGMEGPARERGDPWGVAWSLMIRSMAALVEGDAERVPEAAGLVAESIDSMLQTRNPSEVVFPLLVAAAVAGRLGWDDEARAIAASAHADGGPGFLGSFEIEQFRLAGPYHGPEASEVRRTPADVIELMARAASELPLDSGSGGSVPPGPPAALPGGQATVADGGVNRFVAAGDGWLVAWRGRTLRVGHSKGMADLHTLLGRPEAEVAAIDLLGAGASGRRDTFDARRRGQEEVRRLQAEIDQAEADADLGRLERTRHARDRLVAELAAAYGLADDGPVVESVEKARAAVRWRIRAAIGRIAELDDELGTHLDRSVRTGRFCSYRPAEPTSWDTG